MAPGINSKRTGILTYAVLDIETTGGKFDEEGITEIAIHRFDGHEVVDTFISLINPERPIQPYVQKLTGIDPKMVQTAPRFHQVAKRIVEITRDSVLVAHNAQFDYRILRTEFRRLGYNFERKTLCTVDLSQRLIPDAESHSLGKLVRSLGIPVSNRHRANGDALATLKLLQHLLDRDTGKTITSEVIRAETLGELSNRQLRFVEEAPDSVGVYYLYDKDGNLLYLDGTRDMKRSLNRHFTGESPHSRALRKLTREVRFEKTGSELIARLKAFAEVRENKPSYRPRKKGRQVTPGTALHINGDRFPLGGCDLLLVDTGRSEGERAAVRIGQQGVKGMGYFGLNHQINNIPILENLLTPIADPRGGLGIVAAYLKDQKVLRIVELNESS